MNPTDELSSYYAELLEGSYDCVDRVVLNAYFPMGQTGGGLRTWWRQLHGSDANLNDEQLRDMAGTLSRRLRAYCARQRTGLESLPQTSPLPLGSQSFGNALQGTPELRIRGAIIRLHSLLQAAGAQAHPPAPGASGQKCRNQAAWRPLHRLSGGLVARGPGAALRSTISSVCWPCRSQSLAKQRPCERTGSWRRNL